MIPLGHTIVLIHSSFSPDHVEVQQARLTRMWWSGKGLEGNDKEGRGETYYVCHMCVFAKFCG